MAYMHTLPFNMWPITQYVCIHWLQPWSYYELRHQPNVIATALQCDSTYIHTYAYVYYNRRSLKYTRDIALSEDMLISFQLFFSL